MKLYIYKDRILDAVKMTVSIVARDEVDAAGNPMYQRLAITERDMEMLDNLFVMAMSSLVSELRTVSVKAHPDGLELELPDFDEHVEGYAVSLATSYFEGFVCGKWLEMKGSVMHAPFSNNALASLSNLKSVLFTRKAPSKKYFGEKEEF